MRNDIRVRRRPATVEARRPVKAAPVRQPSVVAPTPITKPAPAPKAASVKQAPVKRPSRARPAPAPPTPTPPAPLGEVYLHGTDLPRTSAWAALATRAVVVVAAVALGAGIVTQAHGQAQKVRSEVSEQVDIAANAIKTGKDHLGAGRYVAAEQEFVAARTALHRANKSLAARGQFGGAGGVAEGQIGSGTRLLSAGEAMAASGEAAAGQLRGITDELAADNHDPFKAGQVFLRHSEQLQEISHQATGRAEDLRRAVQDSTRAGGELGALAGDLDRQLPRLEESLAMMARWSEALPTLLGGDHFRQYLLWFQNPAEIRATGGFIGTYGRLSVDGGKVNELLVDSIYNPANQANTIREPAPAPFGRFYGNGKDPIWGMQDSNWSPDFPTAASKFQYFYEKGGGPTTDGVIAITINPVIEILKVVGPIEMPEYGYVLTAENFHLLIQADQWNRSLAGDNDPKKILRDFTPQLLGKISQATPEQRDNIYRIIGEAYATKELQLWFANPDLAELLEGQPASGVMNPLPRSVAVVDTNIGGGKSSRFVTADLDHELSVDADGRTQGKIVLTRTYANVPDTTVNLNYTRIYLPKGVTVRNTVGFEESVGRTTVSPETTTRGEFTVVGGWTDVGQNASRVVTVEYDEPEKLSLSKGVFEYRLQRQAGTDLRYRTTLRLPEGYRWEDRDGDFFAAGDLRQDLLLQPRFRKQ